MRMMLEWDGDTMHVHDGALLRDGARIVIDPDKARSFVLRVDSVQMAVIQGVMVALVSCTKLEGGHGEG